MAEKITSYIETSDKGTFTGGKCNLLLEKC